MALFSPHILPADDRVSADPGPRCLGYSAFVVFVCMQWGEGGWCINVYAIPCVTDSEWHVDSHVYCYSAGWWGDATMHGEMAKGARISLSELPVRMGWVGEQVSKWVGWACYNREGSVQCGGRANKCNNTLNLEQLRGLFHIEYCRDTTAVFQAKLRTRRG